MLFDKDGIYYDTDTPNYYDFAIDIINGNAPKRINKKDIQMNYQKESKIYDLKEALKRGNAFPMLYNQYKNYVPGELKVKNQREKDLLEIQMLDFSITDLNLYLDTHPFDTDAYNLFKKYVMECKKKKEEYTNIYGPLTLDYLTDEWEWSKGVWPWEEGAM